MSFLTIWFGAGFISFVLGCFYIIKTQGYIIYKDIAITSLFFFLGPIALGAIIILLIVDAIEYFWYEKNNPSFWETRLFEKKDD